MPSFTKKAILDAFLRIAAKKPLEKITVRDIVDACGVNRNTFYYYFQDIYAVVEELGRISIASVPQDRSLGETLELLYLQWALFMEEHPRAMRSFIISLGADGADRYFAPMLDEVLLAALSHDMAGTPLPPARQQLLLDFVRCALIGVCVNTARQKDPPASAVCGAELRRLGGAMLTGLRQDIHTSEENRKGQEGEEK